MAVKSKVTKAKKGNTYKIVLDGLTEGELLSLRNGMEKYAEVSPVGNDVHNYITRAWDEHKEEQKS
jgi:hypothetical protein